MNDCEKIFREKAELLKKCLLSEGSFGELFEKTSAEVCAGYAAFISVCDGASRARVFRFVGKDPESAWQGAVNTARKYVSSKNVDPKWIKADVVVKSNSAPITYVLGKLANGFHEFFRRGIAFGDTMDNALIEAEINGNRLLAYKEQTIKLDTLNKYFGANGMKALMAMPDSVILFDCLSVFGDENGKTYPLYGEGHRAGRRVIDGISKELLLHIITTSSDYLAMMVGFDGKFDYGYYPIFHKEIPGYNILRHSSSIWSLICAYRITGDKFTLRQIETSVGYMISNTVYKYRPSPDKENTVFLADKSKGEVKIGGNAVAIIMLTEYMNVLGSDKYVKLCRELGNGILELFDMTTGRFFHVLNYPQFSPKEAFRTVYYDGETVFALCRLYGLTGEQRWLDAAKRAADRFIDEDYTIHRDHWVAYAINELTKYVPEDKYLSFGLKNANVNLKPIYERVTTYHTYLELLTVTFELYDRITAEKLPCSYLSEFDAEYFVKTIYHRAEWMLNGYAYPEYVMYFKYPERALGAFFVRHDGYRIRIDDIQHFCGAYYSFYRNYEKLEALKNSFGITEP